MLASDASPDGGERHLTSDDGDMVASWDGRPALEGRDGPLGRLDVVRGFRAVWTSRSGHGQVPQGFGAGPATAQSRRSHPDRRVHGPDARYLTPRLPSRSLAQPGGARAEPVAAAAAAAAAAGAG